VILPAVALCFLYRLVRRVVEFLRIQLKGPNVATATSLPSDRGGVAGCQRFGRSRSGSAVRFGDGRGGSDRAGTGGRGMRWCMPRQRQSGELMDQAASSYSWTTTPRLSRRMMFPPTVVVGRGTGCSSFRPR